MRVGIATATKISQQIFRSREKEKNTNFQWIHNTKGSKNGGKINKDKICEKDGKDGFQKCYQPRPEFLKRKEKMEKMD